MLTLTFQFIYLGLGLCETGSQYVEFNLLVYHLVGV